VPIDRRIVRTRTALYDALVALIRERAYASIRVEDIVERANVGRSTFYAHFRSKDELLERSLERLRAELTAAIAGVSNAGLGDVSRALFRHINGHRDIHASLAGSVGREIVLQAIASNLAHVMRTLMPSSQRPRLPRELAIAHIASTFLTVLRWWLDRNPRLSWQEADQHFRAILLDGLADDWPEVAAGPEQSWP
jgi:AcrR family transcriptional regulator